MPWASRHRTPRNAATFIKPLPAPTKHEHLKENTQKDTQKAKAHAKRLKSVSDAEIDLADFRSSAPSGYYGVSYSSKDELYYGRFRLNGKAHYVGAHPDAEACAHAVARKFLSLGGEIQGMRFVPPEAPEREKMDLNPWRSKRFSGGYIGVSKQAQGTFQASFKHGTDYHVLGAYPTAEAAAMVVVNKYVSVHGAGVPADDSEFELQPEPEPAHVQCPRHPDCVRRARHSGYCKIQPREAPGADCEAQEEVVVARAEQRDEGGVVPEHREVEVQQQCEAVESLGEGVEAALGVETQPCSMEIDQPVAPIGDEHDQGTQIGSERAGPVLKEEPQHALVSELCLETGESEHNQGDEISRDPAPQAPCALPCAEQNTQINQGNLPKMDIRIQMNSEPFVTTKPRVVSAPADTAQQQVTSEEQLEAEAELLPCLRKEGCVRRRKHGGHCKTPKVAVEQVRGIEQDERCLKDINCIRGYNHGGHGGCCSSKGTIQQKKSACDVALNVDGSMDPGHGDATGESRCHARGRGKRPHARIEPEQEMACIDAEDGTASSNHDDGCSAEPGIREEPLAELGFVNSEANICVGDSLAGNIDDLRASVQMESDPEPSGFNSVEIPNQAVEGKCVRHEACFKSYKHFGRCKLSKEADI